VASTLNDGDSVEVQGSSSRYKLSRQGQVYMCSCPAWRNQGATVDQRTCKHLRAYLGDDIEIERIGSSVSVRTPSAKAAGSSSSSAARKDTAPPVILAHKMETDHDPTGWWMSEKLDGIRAYWDGEAFVSRLGNRFFAPAWFVEALPADTLDGELWVARKMFQKTTSIVRSGSSGEEWKKVAFVIFDAPNAKGGFEDRIAHAKRVVERANAPHARCLEHVRCEGFAHLKQELARVESLGGEGLMLRRPNSAYEVGRSGALLKVKTFHDTEARVVAHAAGAGKHKGRLGALVCELENGTRFNVGTGFSDDERQSPPRIGAIITFRYQELSDSGVPRFPSYVGERIDAEFGATSQPAAVAKIEKPTSKKPALAEKSDVDVAEPANSADSFAAKLGAASFVCKLLHSAEGKFWHIEVRGSHHITRFGKVGSQGQMRLTEIGNEMACTADAKKRAMTKRREGYELAE
jgi:DNA ligase 1